MIPDEVVEPPALVCRGLTVTYASKPVLRDLDLTVEAGEAVAVLGPSGCGKTTLLHTVAGFVSPERGSVTIAGRVVADGRRSASPEHRRVGVVFQNYALWPHLTALDTVAYPLRRGGLARTDARRQAAGLLTRLGVAHLAARRPAELSGGEQQRVGVARALARDSALYLFDEPTAHLDTALRGVLQEELAAQRSALGAAVLYATHDVAEAFAVADRVALLRDGSVLQIGAPQEVYQRPVDLWAGRLTGPASVLELPVVRTAAGTVELSVAGASVAASVAGSVPAGGPARVLLRPEWVRLGGPVPGRVAAVRYRGADTDYRLETPAGMVDVRERGAPRLTAGAATGWTIDRAWLLPPERAPGTAEVRDRRSGGPVNPRSGPDRSAPIAH